MAFRLRFSSGTTVLSAVLALCPILGLFGCSPGDKSTSARQPPEAAAVPVTTVLASRRSVPVTIRSIGTAEAVATVSVRTMVNGQLTRIGFREGGDVRKGDLLFVIDPRPYDAALRTAEANLARDIALKENAEKETRRYASLIEKDLVPREQYDQIASNATALAATVAADNALVENARVQRDYCTIRSPLSGRTGTLFVTEGNVVKANDTILVTINRISPIDVSFSVPERRLDEIRRYRAAGTLRAEAVVPGQEDRPSEGTLTFIGNAVDNATGTIPLKASFPNEDRRLWPGQFVDVTMTLANIPDAVLVPTPAVQTGQQGQYVFVVRDDRTAEVRTVVVGEAVGGETVVVKGIREGERVVTDGQLRLVPGARVEIKAGAGE